MATLDKILKKLNDMEKSSIESMTTLNCNMLETEQRLNVAINATETRIIKTVQEKFVEIDSRLERAESKIDNIESDTAANNQKLLELEMKVNQHNLLLFNFKDTEESEAELLDMVIELCEKNLKVPIFRNDFDEVRRLGKKQEGKDRPVLLILYSLNIKTRLLRSRSNLKNTKIVISEN